MDRNESWQGIHIPNFPMKERGKELLIPKSGRKSKLQGFKGSKLVKNATKASNVTTSSLFWPYLS